MEQQFDLTKSHDWPQARAGDVDSINSLMSAFDDILTFGPGEARLDRDRMKSLFVPGAAVSSPKRWELVSDVDAFCDMLEKIIIDLDLDKTGFRESNEIIKNYSTGSVHALFTHYALPDDENGDSMGHGINMWHIIEAAGRFWIASLAWEDESSEAPTPDDLKVH